MLAILKEIVEKKGPGFYAVRDIADLLKFQLSEEWINPDSVGRILKRLGFTEKKRDRQGAKIRLTEAGIKKCHRQKARF